MPFPPLVTKVTLPARGGWRTRRYQQHPPPPPKRKGGGEVVANESSNPRVAEPRPANHPDHRRRQHRSQALPPPLPQQQYDRTTAVTRLERHNAALVKENCALKTRLKKAETELAAYKAAAAEADAARQAHEQRKATAFRVDAATFLATGIVPPKYVEKDVSSGKGAVGPKTMAKQDAEAELVEIKAVEMPDEEKLTNQRTHAEYKVEEGQKNLAAAAKALRSTEVHFNAIRPKAAAQIAAAVVAGTVQYASAVEQADVAIEHAVPPPAAQFADAAPASGSSSRDACSATLAELGNTGPLAKDAKVQVVVNNAFVDAIVVGRSARAGAAATPNVRDSSSAAGGRWDVLVFEENLNWWDNYTAGFTRASTLPRADIYGGDSKIKHALPESCFQVFSGAGGSEGGDGAAAAAAVKAVQHAQCDHTDPGYALILLAYGEENLAEFTRILKDVASTAGDIFGNDII